MDDNRSRSKGSRSKKSHQENTNLQIVQDDSRENSEQLSPNDSQITGGTPKEKSQMALHELEELRLIQAKIREIRRKKRIQRYVEEKYKQ